MEKNNITSSKNNISKGKYEKYINEIFKSENEQTIIILISFLDYEDFLNFQQLNKHIYKILKNRRIIKKYAILGCITEKNRLLFYTSNIDINKMKETILKELVDYNINNKLYENIKKLSNEKYETDKRLKKIFFEIEKDITRTFYTEKFTQGNGNDLLKNILNSVAFIRPEIGYCQGMNFIAAFLLKISNYNEIDTFYLYCFVLEKINGYFMQNFPLFNYHLYLFDYFFKIFFPKLEKHFKELELPLELWIGKWIQTLFIISLPFEETCRIWDYLFIYGFDFIIPICFGIIYYMEENLLLIKDSSDVM
jgi:hypothetical protein